MLFLASYYSSVEAHLNLKPPLEYKTFKVKLEIGESLTYYQ